GEGAAAVPGRADHHADRGKFVLGLNDGEAVLAARRVDAIAPAMTLERLGKRRGRRDRVPRAERRAAIDRAERRRVVAVDEYLVADRVGALDPDAERAFQMRQRVVPAM